MKIKLETVRSSADSSFAIREKRTRSFKGTYHFHPEIELTEIVQGSGARLVGDDISPFAPGDLVLIGANLPHRYVTDEAANAMSHARVIQFSPDFLGQVFWDSVEMNRVRRLFADASRGLEFSSSAAKSSHAIISRLFEASGLPKLICLLELLDFLSDNQKPRPIASAGYVCSADRTEASKISKALDYVQQHMRDPITLEEITELLDVSPATCNRLFRKSLGKTFKDFLIDIRISHSCRLLVETADPIIHVAEASGFRNLSNFNRLFKARKNESPSAYRKRAKGSENTN